MSPRTTGRSTARPCDPAAPVASAAPPTPTPTTARVATAAPRLAAPPEPGPEAGGPERRRREVGRRDGGAVQGVDEQLLVLVEGHRVSFGDGGDVWTQPHQCAAGAAADGELGEAELRGGLRDRAVLPVAEDDDRAVGRREAPERRRQVETALGGDVVRRHLGQLVGGHLAVAPDPPVGQEHVGEGGAGVADRVAGPAHPSPGGEQACVGRLQQVLREVGVATGQQDRGAVEPRPVGVHELGEVVRRVAAHTSMTTRPPVWWQESSISFVPRCR